MQAAQKVVPLQSSMQAALVPWHTVEQWLKKATHVNHPISISSLFNLEEVQKVAKNRQQIKDIVTAFLDKGQVTKHDLTPEQRQGDGRDRVGYMWNKDYSGEPYRPAGRVLKRMVKKPSAVTTKTPKKRGRPAGTPNKKKDVTSVQVRRKEPVMIETPKAVELEFHGLKVTVSRNPDNGNMRLQIDALEQ